MATSATIRRGNSRTRVGSTSGKRSSRSGSTSSSRRTSRSGSRSGSRSSLSAVPNDLDFNGLQATIEVMSPDDLEYEDTCLIFLSSRYQNMAPFHRMHKDSQLISKEQWVEYWTQTIEDTEKRISRRCAAKMYDTCSFLAKGKSGVTPTGIDNLQKTLPRRYRQVTSAGAARQLSRYSWYVNGQERRDISRPSQVLTPQKYEELIARLRAESQSARDELTEIRAEHQHGVRTLKDKLINAKKVVNRLKAEIAELKGTGSRS